MNKISKLVNIIEDQSQRPMENKKLIYKYIEQSITNKKIITFYNWECPPRFLDKDKKRNLFVNYNVNLDNIFEGEKIDKFTELPRVVIEKEREIKFIKLLQSLGLKFRFVKIIADTNAFYITPKSLKILGKGQITNKFLEFQNKIRQVPDKEYPIDVEVVLFTTLMNKLRQNYNQYLNQTLKLVNKIISNKTWNNYLLNMKNHMGFDEKNNKELEKFTRKVIATYGTEGMIFYKLSQTDDFSNCIWLNIEEIDNETIEITNCLRKQYRIENLPMIFPK